MELPGPGSERRKYPRAALRLPARIRWQGRLGMRLELTQTVDVSREGVLVHRAAGCELMSRVWMVFPFVRGESEAVQPEVRGHIARIVPDSSGGYWVGVHFEGHEQNGTPAEGERRRSKRTSLALPIFVRPAGTAWPEESMTHDLSNNGARFETSHAYSPGQSVIAQIPWRDWAAKRQVQGRVVRVEKLPEPPSAMSGNGASDRAGAAAASIAVEWLNGQAAGAGDS